ncbi:hypothetical protein IscW_ISCW004153 [Ixodes scapularis]|uniref:Uncharacterized protein n=1 Tax=Ixodes scapularis TaxID=6945 RepID=B7PJQ6_IXOSC|nr:hypothetical protein IscW_ISCW004153 [Ixodes scapularis]|eukprot:XP_002408395.1 hypothetical protein IscW_ISCW004153 [Ixodes scapularis]
MRDSVVVDAQPYPIELCYDPGKGEETRAQPFNLEARYAQEAAVPHPDLHLDSFTVNRLFPRPRARRPRSR